MVASRGGHLVAVGMYHATTLGWNVSVIYSCEVKRSVPSTIHHHFPVRCVNAKSDARASDYTGWRCEDF